MTAEQQAQLQGFRVHLSIAGSSVVIGGQTYQCLVNEEPLVTPDGTLGQDDREYVSIDFIRSEAPTLAANQRLVIDGDTLQILKTENNTGDKFARYWAVKV